MYCPKCGTYNPDGSRFCEGCGAPLSTTPPEDQTVLLPPKNQASPRPQATVKGEKISFVQEKTPPKTPPAPPAEENTFCPQEIFQSSLPLKQEKPKKPKKTLVWVLVALVVLAGLGVGGWFGWNTYQGKQFEEQLSLGEKYLQELNYEDAVVSLKRAIDIDPRNPEPYLLLADVYVAQEDYVSAVDILEQGYEATGGNEEIAQKQEEVEKQKEEADKLAEEQKQKEEAEKAAAAVLAPVVEYQGNTYYWQYQTDSVESEGIFTNYSYNSNTENQLVCRSSDGTVTPLYTGIGFGDILLLDNRLYFSVNQDVCSIKLDGSDLNLTENVTLEAADPVNGCVILSHDDGTARILESMDVWGNRTQLAEGYFLTVQDGVVYYQLPRTVGSDVKLGSVHTDGSEQLVLASSPLDDTWGYGGIEGIQILGDTVYYSCGLYSGTANLWQGGYISSVKTDGTGYQVLTEDVLDANFSVFLSDGKPVLRWNNSDYNSNSAEGGSLSACMDLETKTITGSPLPNGSLGKVLTDNDRNVWVYTDTSGTPVQLLSAEEGYQSLGSYPYGTQDDGKEWKNITESCYTGTSFYFAVTTSTYESSLDLGWRSGFRRNSTQWYCKNLSTGETELLYSY